MNQLKKAVVFLLLGVFVDELLGIPELWPNLGDNGHIIGLREDGGDPTIHVWCYAPMSIKGLTSKGDFYCSNNPRCKVITGNSNITISSGGRIDYTCPSGGYVLAILQQIDGDFPKDPVPIDVTCCYDDNPRKGCYWVGWQNCFGRPFKFWVPDGYYMAGFRRKLHFDPKNIFSGVWDFYVCK